MTLYAVNVEPKFCPSNHNILQLLRFNNEIIKFVVKNTISRQQQKHTHEKVKRSVDHKTQENVKGSSEVGASFVAFEIEVEIKTEEHEQGVTNNDKIHTQSSELSHADSIAESDLSHADSIVEIDPRAYMA